MATFDHALQAPVRQGWLGRLNAEWHERALWAFAAIVAAHWLEHLVQAVQIWWLGWARPEARGVLGLAFPWLVKSEALHFGFTLSMIAALAILAPGFTGKARLWWLASLGIQAWHFIEHSLLQGQAIFGSYLFGGTVPTSVAQIWVPRVELHLAYNLAVFVPMVVAMVLHARPDPGGATPACTCAL